MQYLIWLIILGYVAKKHWKDPLYCEPEYDVRPTYKPEKIDIQGDITQVK